MPLEPTKHVNGRMWPPGVSGNPNGRPVGSRTAFSQGFLKDLAEVWAERGKETMLHTAETQPATFFAACARLIGPEVKLTIEQSLPGNLSPSDWADLCELLSAIQSALPDAVDRPPARSFATHWLSCGHNATLPRLSGNAPSSDSSDRLCGAQGNQEGNLRRDDRR
jgi:hypothetical protein